MEPIIPREIAKDLPELYSGDEVPLEEKTAVARVYSRAIGWSWYLFEASSGEQSNLYFAWVHGDFPEMGFVSEEEWAEANRTYPGAIAFDETFRPCPFAEVEEFHNKHGFWPRTWAEAAA